MKRPHRLWPQLISLLVVVLVFAVVLSQRVAIGDWFRLRGYTPSLAAMQLAHDDTFTSAAQHLYDINRAAVVPKTGFTAQCVNNGGEKTIVLGCYHSNQAGIYVLQITDDPRLNGVEQVTAAHEMLHAAYDRLSAEERTQVDGWLENYYKNDLTDARIKQTLESYETSEPGQVVNEMHSIFGTEVANLPPQLENYYKRYFIDRGKVTAFAASYQAEFTNRQNQVTSIDRQLSDLKAEIDNSEADLKAAERSLGSQATVLNSYRESGQIATYNAGVPAYNANAASYNRLVTATKTMINQYNQLVTQRNAVAVEQQQLVQELSGNSIQTIPKQ